jgi:hypothetical protein
MFATNIEPHSQAAVQQERQYIMAVLAASVLILTSKAGNRHMQQMGGHFADPAQALNTTPTRRMSP